MAETSYNYSVNDDFPSGKINSDRLTLEIAQSAITIALKEITTVTGGDDINVTIKFKNALPVADKTVLDGDTTEPCGGLIGAHSGEPMPDPVTEEGVPIIAIDGPREATDKKPVMVISPATEGFNTFITSCGDDPNPTPPESGRGSGDQILIPFTTGEGGDLTKSIEVGFIEPIELHDGQVCWKPVDQFSAEDLFSLYACLPANTPTEGGAGNCNLVPTGLGFNVIVPANPGEGTHEINLANAVPIPAYDKDGYWSVNYNTGEVSVAANPGGASWHLYDAELILYFLRNISMANPMGVFDIDVYKTEYVHNKWKLKFQVFKKNAGDGSVSGWIFMFRRKIT